MFIAAGAEKRAADLATQLERQQGQAEREIAQLRESQAATAAALRQLEARGRADGEGAPKAPAGRAVRGRKPSE
jgi:hypothetical protein